MKFEGGFQGRTNKLVDSCYSFWQGAQFPIIHAILAKSSIIEVFIHKLPNSIGPLGNGKIWTM